MHVGSLCQYLQYMLTISKLSIHSFLFRFLFRKLLPYRICTSHAEYFKSLIATNLWLTCMKYKNLHTCQISHSSKQLCLFLLETFEFVTDKIGNDTQLTGFVNQSILKLQIRNCNIRFSFKKVKKKDGSLHEQFIELIRLQLKFKIAQTTILINPSRSKSKLLIRSTLYLKYRKLLVFPFSLFNQERSAVQSQIF